MNWFDLTIISILIVSVVVSLFRGLIREVLSLLIWVGAFWLAWTFVDDGASMLSNVIELPSARALIAFVGLFLAALIVGGIINYLVGQMISKTGLSSTDRFFGAFFGLGRGIIAVTAMVLFLQATPFTQDPWWSESRLQPQFSKLADWVKSKMPEDLAGYLTFIDAEQLKESLTSPGHQDTGNGTPDEPSNPSEQEPSQ
jgi:membrane protein required for colicin V production